MKDPRDLSLDEIWKYQLRLSGFVRDMKARGDEKDVSDLKKIWIKENGFDLILFRSKCFFCTFAMNHSCTTKCPGRLVDKSFHCCRGEYHWDTKPIEFYKRIFDLNEERKGEREKKKENLMFFYCNHCDTEFKTESSNEIWCSRCGAKVCSKNDQVHSANGLHDFKRNQNIISLIGWRYFKAIYPNTAKGYPNLRPGDPSK